MVYGIIAAGEGSRLRADGYHGYKPMVSVAGEALIERLIRIFTQNKATAIYIILNTAQKEIGTFIQNLPVVTQLPLKIIYKDTPSSFHSFYALIDAMIEDHRTELCISTIDPVFREEAFKEYIEAFEQNKTLDGLMAVTSFVEDDKPLYVYVDETLRIRRFTGMPSADQQWISGGIYLLRSKALAVAAAAMQAGISKMRNYQQAIVDAGLYLKAHDLGKIIDIDHVSDIQLAEALIQSTHI